MARSGSIRGLSVFLVVGAAASAASCGDVTGDGAIATRGQALDAVPLIITEVAQSTAFSGTTADKAEVYCTSAGGCAAYKV